MAPLERRPDRRRAPSTLRLVAAMAVAGAVALAAPPALAAGGARAMGKATPRAAAKATAALLPIEGSACLFPIPGQECSEEERRLCDAPPAPDPVVVDCHDPANAWVLEMVGECDMPHLSDQLATGGRERERPHDQSCLESESCGRSPSAAAPLATSLEYQPAIDRVPVTDCSRARRLSLAPEMVRHHPGYARGIEHPPKA